MDITVNGKQEDISQGISILDFLQEKDQQPQQVVVEYNGKIIQREKWSDIIIKENDNLEVLKFVGGGSR